MGIYIDPVTRQRITYDKRSCDITFDLSGDDAIAKEDVPLIGDWSDWTGSGVVSSRSQAHFASRENELQGTDAQIEGGAKLPNLSVVGTNLGTHRRRIIKRYVKI